MSLPPRLETVAQGLLAASSASGEVTLDEIGEAIGTMAVSIDEVDALLTALERHGRRVVGPHGQRGERNLRVVLSAARDLAKALGRRPTIAELATRTRLSESDVRHALALGSVIGR
jgi:hypothetical protein